MASHLDSLVYFTRELLPQGKIFGWNPGNYAGYPQFQMYFPMAFLVMAALNLALPLTVAFKLVCLAGVMGLPLAAAAMIHYLGFKRPAPEIGAVFTLPFLFNQANSAWGGNILSVMSGEFSYSIGLALALVYLGRIYRDIDRGRSIVVNAVLLALVGLFHGYPLLFCVLGCGLVSLDGSELDRQAGLYSGSQPARLLLHGILDRSPAAFRTLYHASEFCLDRQGLAGGGPGASSSLHRLGGRRHRRGASAGRQGQP